MGRSCCLVHPCQADSARKLLMSWWWRPIVSITTLERPQECHKSAFLKKKVTEQATTLTLTASEPCSLTENMMKEGSTGAMSEYLRCELDELVNEDYISINWPTPKGAIVWLRLLVVYWYGYLPNWIDVEERDVYPVRLEDRLRSWGGSGYLPFTHLATAELHRVCTQPGMIVLHYAQQIVMLTR